MKGIMFLLMVLGCLGKKVRGIIFSSMVLGCIGCSSYAGESDLTGTLEVAMQELKETKWELAHSVIVLEQARRNEKNCWNEYQEHVEKVQHWIDRIERAVDGEVVL